MNEVILTKSQSVLTTGYVQDYEGSLVFFSSLHEDSTELRRGLYLELADWEDMGKPEAITITVEPGDTLNP